MQSSSVKTLGRLFLGIGILLTAANVYSLEHAGGVHPARTAGGMSELFPDLSSERALNPPFYNRLSRAAPNIFVTIRSPRNFTLLGNHPNPFNPNTTIAFIMHTHGLVRLGIYGINGQAVKTLLNGPVDAGSYHLTWDGRDDAGNPASSGTYFMLLQTGEQKEGKRITLLK